MRLNITRGFVKGNERVGEVEGSRSTDWFCVYSTVKYFTIMLDGHVYQDIWKFMPFYENSSPGPVAGYLARVVNNNYPELLKIRLAVNQGGNLTKLCS